MNPKQIVIRLDEESYNDLKRLATGSGLSIAYLVRTMIHSYLRSHEKPEKITDIPQFSKFLSGLMLASTTTGPVSETNLHDKIEKMSKDIEEIKHFMEKDKRGTDEGEGSNRNC